MEQQAQIVIVGGGIIGCSIAYHLAQMGVTDVCVVEKGELTSGSTWHAAGLVGQLRSSRNITRMLKYSVELYQRLEAETGQATEWKQSGGLRLACTPERMIELKKQATTAKSFGLEMHLISPREAYDLFPIIDTSGVLGAAYLPTDGYIEPSSVTHALAKGAKRKGVRFLRHTKVVSVKTEGKKVVGVETSGGTIRCQKIVNCAGIWAKQLGAMMGVQVPLIPVCHQFLVTNPIEGLPKKLPTLRDPDHLIYYKEEAGGLVMGGYEPNPIPWSTKKIPSDFGQELLPEDFDHFEQLSTAAMKRTPLLEKAQVRKLINGPEAFTPDGNPIMGLAPELDNAYVCAGFNAHGIASGGGAGKMMAEWIVNGRPSIDLWALDIRRFGPHHHSLRYTTDRTLELYGKHYTLSWPHEEHQSAREVKCSPLYETLKKNGAVFGQKFGQERPNWFAPAGVSPQDEPSFGRPNWFEHVAQEHLAIRENVALIDQSSFSKIKVQGPGAYRYLQWLAVNEIKGVNSLTYTQLCNREGGIECDLTIARLAENEFYIVTGTAFGVHDMDWIKKNAPGDGSVVIDDITQAFAVINICGPKSRQVLNKVCDEDFSIEKFPFASWKKITIGHAHALALRVTYVGELGWELHIPTDLALNVYHQLKRAGEEFGILDAGYRAIESCRLEKGYRYWSSDLTPDYTPFEAGLGFCVAFDKGDFLGKEALIQAKQQGPRERLIGLLLQKDVELLGGETILKDGQVIGVLTSGGLGHTIKKPIAYGYVPFKDSKEETYQVEVLGEKVAAKRFVGSLYDPKRQRILC